MTATHTPAANQGQETAPRIAELPMAKAINEGLRAAMHNDPAVMLMGEDIATLGGVFRVTDGLLKDFGPQRVVDTPLAESGIIGTALGLALAGYKPVVEIQFDGFIFPGFDQITTQLAKYNYRTQGRQPVPVVIRVPYGGHIGAIEHHSESPEALFAHTAGLRVISPATPQDAFVMIQQAILTPDPVLFFEPKAKYWNKGEVNFSPVTEYESMQRARVARPGTDLTIAAYGPSVSVALAAATVAAQEGHEVEVLDLRSISPLDEDALVESVSRTGRLVVVHEAPVFFGAGAEIAARVSQRCFHNLQAPVLRVGGFHSPYPVSAVESHYLPDLDRVLDAVDTALAY